MPSRVLLDGNVLGRLVYLSRMGCHLLGTAIVSSSSLLFHYTFYAGSDQSTCSVVAGLPACA